MLSWDPPTASDFDHFTVYGSHSSSFDGSAVPIAPTAGTTMDVLATAYPHYHLTATDASGNESDAATATNGVTDVPDTPKAYTLGLSAHPNPFNPVTIVTYTTPKAGAVTLAVYDVEGRLVETLKIVVLK